ncbi:MAG: nucleotide exchange factor GrpE [Treponema sp.]|nr:nucleotide exchange factor GrpE [Treponema sp.]
MSEETKKENAESQETPNTAEEKAQENAEQAASEEKTVTPEEKIKDLESQIEELKKQMLYKAAENDNWRKRMMQQKEEALAYANASLLSDLLESLDNFDRTVDAAKDAKDAKTIADGVKMINKSLVKMLEDKYGLSSFGKEGDEFNPELHEAIGRTEDEKAKKETLLQVYMKGYKLHDRIIRHAKVMVRVPKSN